MLAFEEQIFTTLKLHVIEPLVLNISQLSEDRVYYQNSCVAVRNCQIQCNKTRQVQSVIIELTAANHTTSCNNRTNDSQSNETWMNLRPRIDVKRLSCSISMLSASWLTLALPNIDDTVRPSASRSCTQTHWLLTAAVSPLVRLKFNDFWAAYIFQVLGTYWHSMAITVVTRIQNWCITSNSKGNWQ